MNSHFMQRALELAEKAIGFTSPNPAVGAVLVRDGKIIGEGWHKKAGGNHAEIIAIQNSKLKSQNLKGTILYVTLEPCCHYGKTPPCADVIVKSGIKKAVIGMKDPFGQVNGKGIVFLRKHGVSVELVNTKSVQYRAIRNVNQPFIKWAKTGLPFVVLKAAVSLDGKIATRAGESRWITSQVARNDARLERSVCDVVVVGAGTVAADNPELAAHGLFKNKRLLRVIIDSELALDIGKKVFRNEDVLVVCTERVSASNRRRFERAGIAYKSFGKNKISIKKLLKYLGERDVRRVFVEGGAGVHGLFHDERLIDEVIFYIAPKIIGGVGAMPAIGGEGIDKLSSALMLYDVQINLVGEDVKVKGVVNKY